MLVLLRLDQMLGRHIGEPNLIPTLRPRHSRPVPIGPRNPANGLLVLGRAMALPMEEVPSLEEALSVGIMARGVVSEVRGAEGDWGPRLGNGGKEVLGGVGGEEVEVGGGRGGGGKGGAAEGRKGEGGRGGDLGEGVGVDAEEVGDEAEEGGEED